MKIPKPSAELLKHWDDILRKEGLSMDVGRKDWLSYSGNTQDLLRREVLLAREDIYGGKRIRPEGAGSDD